MSPAEACQVKAKLLASAIQSLALRTGVLQLQPDDVYENVHKIQQQLEHFVLTHSPDELHLVLNEPRSKGSALSEFDYPDLEALAFPKAFPDQLASFIPSVWDDDAGTVVAASRVHDLTFAEYVPWVLFQHGGRALGHARCLYYLFNRLQRMRACDANDIFWSDFKRKKLDMEEFRVHALDPRKSDKTISRLHRFMSAAVAIEKYAFSVDCILTVPKQKRAEKIQNFQRDKKKKGRHGNANRTSQRKKKH